MTDDLPPPPPPHTALAALPALVLDLETTGLNVRTDRVVQIGVVAMRGPQILDSVRLDRIVDPRLPMPAAAARIHGLDDAAVAGAPGFEELAPALSELIAGRVVIGHHIAFDLSILAEEMTRHGLVWNRPPALDVALLVGALRRDLPKLDLDSVAKSLGVTVTERHTAMGDCLAVAAIWKRLVPLLRGIDIRTLGEAQAFAAGRQELLRGQVEAGWHAVPAALPGAASRIRPSRLDSYAYEHSVGDLMSAPPALIAPTASLRSAAARMVELGIGSLLVGAANAPPLGIVTERDLLRVSAERPAALDDLPVGQAMSAPVETIDPDAPLYRALGRMDRRRLRHLCVTDTEGCAIGMLSQRDLLEYRLRGAGLLGDALAVAGDAQDLAAAFGQVPTMAASLLAEGCDGEQIARVVSDELRALTARAAALAERDMEAEEMGSAPAAWCLLVLGSGGRGESLLGADQDNALIHAGTEADDPWFATFGERVAGLLDEAGLPRCKGGVMAANAAWRGTVPAWRSRVDAWMQKARPEDLLHVDIFFDLVPVAGTVALAQELHGEAVAAAAKMPPFLALLGQATESFAPRFSMLGRLRTEDGRIDLKRDGLLPLVGLARVLALRGGVKDRGTQARLAAAGRSGRLPEADASALRALHILLLTRIAEQQLADLERGVALSSRVETNRLGRAGLAELRRGLRRLDSVLSALPGLIVR